MLDPVPTPDEVYQVYLEVLKIVPHVKHEIPICDLYHALKKRFRGYKVERFKEMQYEMLDATWEAWGTSDWHGYRVNLMRGILDGVCTKYKRDRATITQSGWKFIEIEEIEMSWRDWACPHCDRKPVAGKVRHLMVHHGLSYKEAMKVLEHGVASQEEG